MNKIYSLARNLLFAGLLSGCVAPLVARADGAAAPLTIADIKALAKAGLSDDVIISQIKATRSVYHITTPQIIELKTDGVSQKVIDFTINTAVNPSSGESTIAPAPFVSTPAPAPTQAQAQPAAASPTAATATPAVSTTTVVSTPSVSTVTVAPAASASYYVAPAPAPSYYVAPYPAVEYYPAPYVYIGPFWGWGHGGGHWHR